MQPNRLKQLLKEGKYTCGSWMSMTSNVSAEVMGYCNFDWLLIDMEHGSGSYQTLVGQLQALAASGSHATPIVRVESNDATVIKRVLDCGAYGVMVPGIRDAEEAKAAVAAMLYPPAGIRGIAGARCAAYGNDKSYVQQANDNMAMFLQIETKEAIENIGAILDVPGIDVAFLGPNDLSAALGHVGNWEHPEVVVAIEKMEKAAQARSIPLGTVSRSWEAAKRCIERGYRAQALMGDVPLMAQAARQIVAQFRAHPNASK